MMSEICLVDDEAGIVEMMRDYLSESFSVRTFTSPEEALLALNGSYRPDLLVTDIKMPEMDGFEFLRHARMKIPGLPVVMMSGYAEKHHVLEAMDQEVFGFVEKPFRPQKLRDLIAQGMEQSRRIRGLETLVEKLNVLSKTSLELNRLYVSRCLAAETRVQQSGVSVLSDQAQVEKQRADGRHQNDLEFLINRMAREIGEILTANPDLALSSIQLATFGKSEIPKA